MLFPLPHGYGAAALFHGKKLATSALKLAYVLHFTFWRTGTWVVSHSHCSAATLGETMLRREDGFCWRNTSHSPCLPRAYLVRRATPNGCRTGGQLGRGCSAEDSWRATPRRVAAEHVRAAWAAALCRNAGWSLLRSPY